VTGFKKTWVVSPSRRDGMKQLKGSSRVDHSKHNFFRRINGKKVALTYIGSLIESWFSICTQTCTQYLVSKSLYSLCQMNSTANLSISWTLRLTSPPSSSESNSSSYAQELRHKIKEPRSSAMSTSFSTCSSSLALHLSLTDKNQFDIRVFQLCSSGNSLARYHIKPTNQQKPIYWTPDHLLSQEHQTSSLCY